MCDCMVTWMFFQTKYRHTFDVKLKHLYLILCVIISESDMRNQCTTDGGMYSRNITVDCEQDIFWLSYIDVCNIKH